MPKLSSCLQITFNPVESLDEQTTSFLEEYFDVLACNYTDDGLEEYVGYIGTDFDEGTFKKESQGFKLPAYKVGTLESENWLKEFVIEFPPIEVEDFLVYGVHEQTPPATSKIPVQVYAATAFGSSHQTTKLCLNAISYLNQQNAIHKNILDIGTGTGILSIAAAKMWKDAAITAVDIDDEAVVVTNQNAAGNNVEYQISTSVSDGYSAELVKKNSPYDIIFANILARPLISMAKDLHKNLKKGGYCVLSGFNTEQHDWVIGEHKKLGLKEIMTYNEDDWLSVVMIKED
jgi:ribosomal protein L11 methyltransferase